MAVNVILGRIKKTSPLSWSILHDAVETTAYVHPNTLFAFYFCCHVPFNRGLFDPNGCDPTKPFSIVSYFQKELLKFHFLKTHTPNRVRQSPERSNLLIETRAMKSTGNYANHFVLSLCPSQESLFQVKSQDWWLNSRSRQIPGGGLLPRGYYIFIQGGSALWFINPLPYIGRIGTSFLYLLLTNGTPLTVLRGTGRTFASSN